jgi:hypothetical protein
MLKRDRLVGLAEALDTIAKRPHDLANLIAQINFNAAPGTVVAHP